MGLLGRTAKHTPSEKQPSLHFMCWGSGQCGLSLGTQQTEGGASSTGGPSVTCSASYDFAVHGNEARSVIMDSAFHEPLA